MKRLLTFPLLILLLAAGHGMQPAQAAIKEFQQPNAYAVVIGIGQYREEVIPKVAYAVQDAQAIAGLLETQAGIPKTHIKVLTDARATLSDLRNHLGEWLRMRVKADSTVYVYYAGHGTPNLQTQSGAIVPWDGHPDFPAGLYPLKELEDTLSKLPTKNVVVFLDSCFSGGAGRSVIAKGARPMGLQYPVLSQGEVMVLAAATGTQISSDYDKARHGLFTHYLLAGLRGEADGDKDGLVTLKELFPFVRDRVANTAVEELNREQTPVLFPGDDRLGKRETLPLAKAILGSTAPEVSATKSQTSEPKSIEVAKAYTAPQQTGRDLIGKDGTPMVLIPAGEFQMGSPGGGLFGMGAEGEADEHPQHAVYLDAFYIGKLKITNSQYQTFIKATGHRAPTNCCDPAKFDIWRGGIPFEGTADLPVINVDWHDAFSYCAWAGGRLPTEAEWEKAARGTDGRIYPWGNQAATRSLANFSLQEISYWDGPLSLTRVNQYDSGQSPYGVFDMAGNVWDWVQDWYSENYYQDSPSRNPMGPAKGTAKVIRGGSWRNTPDMLRSANRNKHHPSERRVYVGFRCAQDAPK
jgi:formylglycine-generating enzyme